MSEGSAMRQLAPRAIAVISLLFIGKWAFAQTTTSFRDLTSGTQPAADKWDDVDKRLIFLTTQLASNEQSILAIEKCLVKSRYKRESGQASIASAQKGN